jgi:hypothetical protein
MSHSTSDGSAAAGLFVPHVARTGAVEVHWAPPGRAARLRVWVLLGDPAALSAADFEPSRLLPRLLRVPVEPAARVARVHVPVGRPLGVAIVGDAHDGTPLTARPERCVDLPLDPPAPLDTDAPRAAFPEAPAEPARRAHALAVLPGEGAAAIDALARRLSAQHPAQPAPPAPGGFGLTQPFYPGRLAFPPGTADVPRVLVHRAGFISADALAEWREAPPADAISLPEACDGVIDCLTSEGRTSFFALLEGPAPWRVQPLSPSAPPFAEIHHPATIGNAPATAAALAARAATASGPLRELLLAAMNGLPQGP